jgi:hypothetical protein
MHTLKLYRKACTHRRQRKSRSLVLRVSGNSQQPTNNNRGATKQQTATGQQNSMLQSDNKTTTNNRGSIHGWLNQQATNSNSNIPELELEVEGRYTSSVGRELVCRLASYCCFTLPSECKRRIKSMISGHPDLLEKCETQPRRKINPYIDRVSHTQTRRFGLYVCENTC